MRSPYYFREILKMKTWKMYINARDEFGVTPLHHAVNSVRIPKNRPEIIRGLLEHGADVNAKNVNGDTPLHIAVIREHAAVVAVLLCHPKIDVHALNNNKKTPFQSTSSPISAMLWLHGARYTGTTPDISAMWDAKIQSLLELEHMGIFTDTITTLLYKQSPPSSPPLPKMTSSTEWPAIRLHCIDANGTNYVVDAPPQFTAQSKVIKDMISDSDNVDIPVVLPFCKSNVEFVVDVVSTATAMDPYLLTSGFFRIREKQQAVEAFHLVSLLDISECIEIVFSILLSHIRAGISIDTCVPIETRMEVLGRYPQFVKQIKQEATVEE
jgi:hypothetical protein